MHIKATIISSQAFSPFGGLVHHDAEQPLAVVSDAFAHHPDATIPALEWVRPKNSVSLPMQVEKLERHPFSAQTFLPHKQSSFLVVVCETDKDGAPKMASAKAFIVPSDIGVTFARGVWHRSLAPLEEGSGYTMAMMRTGRDDDTQFHDLAQPITISSV
jgi:ureidoglycolate lyase